MYRAPGKKRLSKRYWKDSNRHTMLKQHWFNIDSMSRLWINVESTLFQCCVPAGMIGILCVPIFRVITILIWTCSKLRISRVKSYAIWVFMKIMVIYRALQEADVVLLLGARLNWILHFGAPPRFRPDVKIIQVCLSSLYLNKTRTWFYCNILTFCP